MARRGAGGARSLGRACRARRGRVYLQGARPRSAGFEPEEAHDAGYAYCEATAVFQVTYEVPQAKLAPGTYRNISGNQALALGFVAASRKSGLRLFQGSYPITPASDILHELSVYKNFGVVTFQAEDEIAAVGAAIGASFAGALGITTTSGPGMALKSEFIGLAVMVELPLVVVDIQRGGPSTGLPTKTEQADLLQAMFGRHSESPCIVIGNEFEAKVDGASWGFAGTRLLTGEAQMRVIYVGSETLYGEIARSATRGAQARTPQQTADGQLVVVLIVGALLLCLTLGWVRWQQGHGLLDGHLSALTLAVAALPEEFPVVLTFFLGVGVYRLARRKALVRRAVVVESIRAQIRAGAYPERLWA